MRKFILIWVAMCLFLTAPVMAAAQDSDYNLVDCIDFSIAVPNDLEGYMEDTISDNVPFIYIYTQYDESDTFLSNLSIVWNSAYEDISLRDPEEFAQYILSNTQASFESVEVTVDNPTIFNAEFSELGGKPALAIGYSMDLDYNNAGMDLQTTLYFLQTIVSDAELGTYTFMIGTDDLSDIDPLETILRTLIWTA